MNMTMTSSLAISRLYTVHEINLGMIIAKFLMQGHKDRTRGTGMTHKPQPGCGLMWKEGPSCVDQLLTHIADGVGAGGGWMQPSFH